MSIFSLISDLWKNLSSQKLRTFLTLFGIMWGTATLIILLAFGMGFRDQMMLNMRGMGEEIVIMFPSQTTKPFEGYGIGRQISFRENDAWMLEQQVSGIKKVSPEYRRSATLRYGNQYNSPSVTGVYSNYGELRNVFPQEGGRWFNDRDISERRRVIFIGDELKRVLFGDKEAVGERILVNGIPFNVIGVMQPKVQNSTYGGGRDEDRAFIPATTFSTMFNTKQVSNIIYQTSSVFSNDLIEDQVYERMGNLYKFDPEDRSAISIWDTAEFLSFIYYFALGFNIFLGIIGFFTLAVGGIGVANIMFVVVQERMKEIGIRRSVGARRKHIITQFFSETLAIVAIGAAIGYAIAWVIVQALQNIPIGEYVGTPEFTPMIGLVAFVVLTMVGIAAGLMPAIRASKLNIVDCLRA